MRSLVPALTFLALMAAAPAQAQQPAQKPAPAAAPRKASPLVFRGYFSFDVTSLTASETYNAVLGSSTVTALGGGGEIGGLWKQLFLRAGVGFTNETGERAHLVDGDVVPTGIPIEIKMMPIEVLAGWRFRPGSKPYSFHVGGGPVFFKYSETSEFGGPEDNVDDMYTGFAFYGGISVDLGRWVFVSGEGGYRSVPDSIGERGLSEVFGETDLGGVVLRVMVGIRSKK
jgi:hypothetical protein